MQVSFPPFGIGSVIAIVVIVFAVLGMAGVLPFDAIFVFGLIAALGIARLT